MKTHRVSHHTTIMLVLVTTFATTSSLLAEQVRLIQSLDKDWRFSKNDTPDAKDSTFDGSAWRKLNVPHDWSIEGPFAANLPAGGSGGNAPTGVVWYRKNLILPSGLNIEIKNKNDS